MPAPATIIESPMPIPCSTPPWAGVAKGEAPTAKQRRPRNSLNCSESHPVQKISDSDSKAAFHFNAPFPQRKAGGLPNAGTPTGSKSHKPGVEQAGETPGTRAAQPHILDFKIVRTKIRLSNGQRFVPHKTETDDFWNRPGLSIAKMSRSQARAQPRVTTPSKRQAPEARINRGCSEIRSKYSIWN